MNRDLNKKNNIAIANLESLISRIKSGEAEVLRGGRSWEWKGEDDCGELQMELRVRCKLNNTVPFNRDDVQKYIDSAIRSWRKKRDDKNVKFAEYYIDAFQSVRASLFGCTLPTDDDQDNKECPVEAVRNESEDSTESRGIRKLLKEMAGDSERELIIDSVGSCDKKSINIELKDVDSDERYYVELDVGCLYEIYRAQEEAEDE